MCSQKSDACDSLAHPPRASETPGAAAGSPTTVAPGFPLCERCELAGADVELLQLRIAQLEQALSEANQRHLDEVAAHSVTQTELSAALEGAAAFAMEYTLEHAGKDEQGAPRTEYDA